MHINVDFPIEFNERELKGRKVGSVWKFVDLLMKFFLILSLELMSNGRV